eukprot:6251556-Amphidinium_carterae.1
MPFTRRSRCMWITLLHWLGNNCADAEANAVSGWHPLHQQLPAIQQLHAAMAALVSFVAEIYEEG